MLGRATGVCGGRAGSMNVIDVEHGLVGCFGIVGGSIAAATGAALAAKRQGRVAVAMFGDGATNQGYFHECLNFAKVFSLPAVFVCENNFYGEFTPMTRGHRRPGHRRARRRVRDPIGVVDGNDVWAVREAALEAVHRARSGSGPTLLECQTYRHHGHSKADPARYRPPEEVERWLARDPLTIARGASGRARGGRGGASPRSRRRPARGWTARSRGAGGAVPRSAAGEHATEFAP